MPEGCAKGERGKLANERGSQSWNPVDESTAEGAGESGDGGRAKGTMQIRDKAYKRKARESEVDGVRDG